MKNIVDIFQAALSLKGLKAGLSPLLQSTIDYLWFDDGTSRCCMCCCCDNGCR